MKRNCKPRTHWDDLSHAEYLLKQARIHRDDIKHLQEALAYCPGLVRDVGDVAENAERAWVDMAADGKVDVAACVQLRVDGLRAELSVGGAKGDVFDRLLVDRVVITWLQVHTHEGAEALSASRGEPVHLQAKRSRRINVAQQGYRAALRDLLDYRRLKPAVTAVTALGPTFASGRRRCRGTAGSRISR